MGLDSAFYLCFLFCVAALHAVLPPRGRVIVLLCASLAFYAASSVSYLVLLLILCGLNYAAVRSLSRATEERPQTGVFIGAVALNLAVLILFKYETKIIGAAIGRLGWGVPKTGGVVRIAAPLGLSYVTFQMLACITDVYRRTWKLDGGLGRFVLFGFFFPQISSGPIPRAERLFPQLLGDKPTTEDRLAGLRLIAYGLFKKFVVANRLSEYVGSVFDDKVAVSTLPALLACCFNALQLYADFSGYVDIAIGSARFLGIRLDPNFDRPFVSTSVTEFWRRWHMSLSFWLRDYLYMPMLIRIRDLGRIWHRSRNDNHLCDLRHLACRDLDLSAFWRGSGRGHERRDADQTVANETIEALPETLAGASWIVIHADLFCPDPGIVQVAGPFARATRLRRSFQVATAPESDGSAPKPGPIGFFHRSLHNRPLGGIGSLSAEGERPFNPVVPLCLRAFYLVPWTAWITILYLRCILRYDSETMDFIPCCISRHLRFLGLVFHSFHTISHA